MTIPSGRHLAIAALCALAVTGAGARPQAPAPSQPPPQFRAAVTIVEVDAIVTDRAGKFVEGLAIDDFEVLEEGTPQQVQVLYLADGGSLTLIAGAAPRPAGLETGAAEPAPAALQRVFVLFIDEEHVDAGEFKRLQAAAEQFLSTDFKPGDLGGVLVGGRMAGNQLTTDREALIAAVRAAKPNQAQLMRKMDLLDWPRISEVEAIRIALLNDKDVLDQVVRRAAEEGGRGPVDLRGTVMEKGRFVVDQLRPAAARTVRTLQALISGLGRVPGRKTVVLMTDGFFVEESWSDLRQLVGLAARANVRIYSLDAMGLRRNDRTTSLNQATPLETGASLPLEAYNTIEDGPNTLAVDTGGYVIRHTNDFDAALAEIARDTSRYYVLGYMPSDEKMDGQFRSIGVRVKRDGVRVRARRGYLATPVAPAPPAPGTAPPKPPEPGAPQAAPPATLPPGPLTAAPPPAAVPATPAAPTAAPLTASPEPAVVSLRPDAEGRVRDLAARAADSGAAKSLASSGWDRYSQGDLEGAETLLAQAAAVTGAAPWVSYALGFAQVAVKKPQEAARSWERVRAAAPEFEAVYLDLADVYLQLDDSGRALEILRAAEARWPEDADVLNAVGTVQVRRGSLNDAIEIFGRAIAAQPADSLAHLNLARTYELRYYKMRRYSKIDGRWIDNPDDLKRAIASYEMYLKAGGPYEDEARAALERLRWVR